MSVTVLDSFEDAVETDYDGELDGDDSTDPLDRKTLLAQLPPPPRFMMSARGLLVPKTAIVVPFPTGVNQGDHSDAVYAVKRAWARKEGRGRLKQLESKSPDIKRTWQKTFSVEFGATSYTKARHQNLAPWFDQKCLSLLRVSTAQAAHDKIIATELAWHNALYNRRWAVPYSQTRPSQLVSADRITRGDCSGSIAGGCAWAKILPKVDWRYTNTWVQIALGTAVAGVNEAIPGDVFLYGRGSSPTHEALYLGNGIVWSFGSYPMKILPHNYRHDRIAIRRFVSLPH